MGRCLGKLIVSPPVEFAAVEGFDSSLGFRLGAHGDEAEAA